MAHARITTMITGLRTFVRANLGAELAAVGAELSLTIPGPASVDHFIGMRDPFKCNHYPTAFYVLQPQNPENAGQYGGMENALILPLRIDLVIVFRHATPETLEQYVLGYADALTNILAADPSVGGMCDEAWMESVDPEHGDSEIAAIVAEVVMSKELRT